MGGYRAPKHYTDAGSRCDVVLSTLSAHALQTQGDLLANSRLYCTKLRPFCILSEIFIGFRPNPILFAGIIFV